VVLKTYKKLKKMEKRIKKIEEMVDVLVGEPEE
jgi:hypothetical protein